LSVLRTPYELIFIVAAFTAIMGAYLGKSQWEYFIHGGQSFSMGVYRLKGIDTTYAHPNAVACSAVISLPFAYYFWKIRREFTATWPEIWKKAFPLFIVGVFYLAVSSIFLTNSRSGIFAFVLFLFLSALHGKSVGTMIFRVLGGVVVLAAIWMIIPEATKGRIENTWDPTSGPDAESAYVSGEGRVRGVQMGMIMFETHPLTGVGLGNFIPYRRAYLDGVNLVAHNTAGGVLGETGLIGGFAFLVFLSGIFVNCHAAKRMAARREIPDADMLVRLAVACRDSLVLLLFCGMFGDVQARAHLYWIAAYCLLARTFLESIAWNSLGDYEMD
jgi:O-antigen ligase